MIFLECISFIIGETEFAKNISMSRLKKKMYSQPIDRIDLRIMTEDY